MLTTSNNHRIRTSVGRLVDPTNLRAEDISIHDIAHALSQIPRFNGHLRRFHSVAMHCLAISWKVPPEDALWGLLHDASEAYLMDIPSPVKSHPKMEFYREWERAAMSVICEVFRLSKTCPKSVREADRVAVEQERLEDYINIPQIDVYVPPAEVIEARFLDRFFKLTGLER